MRPTVRGTAMNPVDHPHGGGEGKNKTAGRHPVTPWGVPTKGHRTRQEEGVRPFDHPPPQEVAPRNERESEADEQKPEEGTLRRASSPRANSER